jgi:hypothetical protein
VGNSGSAPVLVRRVRVGPRASDPGLSGNDNHGCNWRRSVVGRDLGWPRRIGGARACPHWDETPNCGICASVQEGLWSRSENVWSAPLCRGASTDHDDVVVFATRPVPHCDRRDRGQSGHRRDWPRHDLRPTHGRQDAVSQELLVAVMDGLEKCRWMLNAPRQLDRHAHRHPQHP